MENDFKTVTELRKLHLRRYKRQLQNLKIPDPDLALRPLYKFLDRIKQIGLDPDTVEGMKLGLELVAASIRSFESRRKWELAQYVAMKLNKTRERKESKPVKSK